MSVSLLKVSLYHLIHSLLSGLLRVSTFFLFFFFTRRGHINIDLLPELHSSEEDIDHKPVGTFLIDVGGMGGGVRTICKCYSSGPSEDPLPKPTRIDHDYHLL